MELLSSNIKKNSGKGKKILIFQGNGNPKKASYISGNSSFELPTRFCKILN